MFSLKFKQPKNLILKKCIVSFINKTKSINQTLTSAGSRISRLGGADLLWGADLRRIHFLAKTYVKTKEIDPVGGGTPAAPLDPPMLTLCCVINLGFRTFGLVIVINNKAYV